MASGYGYSNDAYWDAILGNHGAIYVVDYDEHEGLPIVGHAYVLLKGSDGKWIRTEFMGDFEGFGENIIETLVNFIDAKKDATVSYDDEIQVSQIISDLSIEAVSQHWTLSDGSTLTGFCAGVQYVPLKGDFSPGIEKADGYCGSDYGGYSLFSNNCLHYAKEILCEGTARNQPTENFLHESENFIPMVFASELRSIEV